MEMNFITYRQAEEIDQKTIEKGIPEKILMGLASQSAFITMLYLNLIKKQNFYIFLCGSGNNGGDGFTLAYLLLSSLKVKKKQIEIFCSQPKKETSQYYQNLLLNYKKSFYSLEDFISKFQINALISKYKKIIFIEALLGSGQKDLPKEPILQILKKLKKFKEIYKKKIIHIALDVPAGLSEEYQNFNSRSFLDFFDLPIPDFIFNFGLPKFVLGIHPKINAYSKIYYLPCGFDPKVEKEVVKNNTQFIQLKKTKNFEFLYKQKEDHKYTSGYGWIFAGSKNLEGASLLASKSFFYSGGGILHLIHFSKEKEIFLKFDPSIIYHHINEFKENYQNLKIPNCIAIGTGISSEDFKNYKFFFINFLKYLSKLENLPVILLDAYSTKLILESEYPENLKKYTIITPHLGEWKELGGAFPYLVKNWDLILEFHKKMNCSVLIKGSISFFIPYFFKEENKVYIWEKQNQNLATAGSGDILIGILCRYFSKMDNQKFPEFLLKGIELILSLQNEIAKDFSTSYEHLQKLKEFFRL